MKMMDEIQVAVDAIQEMFSIQSEQIGRLRDEVTGMEGGHPGGGFAPYSLTEIGNMLHGLQAIFEPQLKAKAFEVFDEAANRFKNFWNPKSEDQQEEQERYVQMIARDGLGLQLGMLDRFYQEWKTQRSYHMCWYIQRGQDIK